MNARRLRVCCLVPLVLAALCALLYCLRAWTVETSLYDLLGPAGKTLPAALRNPAADLVPVLMRAPDFESARTAAANLAVRLPAVSPAVLRVHARTDGADFADFLSFCRAHPAGLVAPSAAELLETPQGRARLARRALRMYLATPVPPLFSPAEDPFGLLNGYVASLPSLYAGWSPREGFLVAPDATDTVVLVVLELAPAVLADTRKLVEFKQAFDALCAQIVHPPVSVVACGVPLHTATTAARCQREMGALTVFSVLFIAGLGFVVFKSFRWLPCVFLTLLCALLTGLAALLLCFASVHALTFVLGTTLLGLVVDYAFHRLLQPAQNAAAVAKGLCLSCLTTEISLLPLLFSAIPVLCQTAVFLGAGLAASLASVLFLYPPSGAAHPRTETPQIAAPRRGVGPWTALRAVLPVLFGAAGVLLLRATFATTPQALYRPPAALAAAENFLAQRMGSQPEGARGFLVIEGNAPLDTLLQTEESLGLADGLPHLSRLLPSLPLREKRADQIAALYAEQGPAQTAALGLAALAPPPPPRPWQTAQIPATLRRTFLREGTLVSTAAAFPPGTRLPRGVGFWRPQELLARVLTQWTRYAARALLVSLGLILLALLLVYRRRAWGLLVPSLCALAFAGGLLTLRGDPVNLFHLLAGFLLLGMSMDYTIFLWTGGRAAFRPVLCSMLTSLAGFGALVFVSFPVVQSFGFVLGVGLPAAFLAAWAFRPRATCR